MVSRTVDLFHLCYIYIKMLLAKLDEHLFDFSLVSWREDSFSSLNKTNKNV